MTSPPSPPNRRRRRIVVTIAALLLVSLVSWWNWPRGDARFVGTSAVTVDGKQQPTVLGPESADVVNQISGHLVWSPLPSERMVAVSLPDGKQTTVISFDVDNDDSPRIHSLSGPDDEGRIAYVEDHFFVKNKSERRHLLKTVRLDGTKDTALFSRPGDAMWATTASGKGEIGEHLALSPTGGNVVFVSSLSDKQMPTALFHQGALEIWNIESKRRSSFSPHATDASMCWFPDGKRLAYVRFVARKNLPKAGVQAEEFGAGDYTGAWDELPAIHILDLVSGKTRFLSLGWIPVVAADGQAVFIGGWVSQPETGIELIWKRVEVSNGEVSAVSWPGDARGLIANPTDDLVLYWGLPTAGVPIRHSQLGSFRRGLMLLTIKAAALNSNRFQTVIPEIDPREPLSFGLKGQK